MNKEELYDKVKAACANGSPGVGKRVALLDEFRKHGLTPRDLDEMISLALAGNPAKAKDAINPGYTTSAPYVGHQSIEMPPRVEIKHTEIKIEKPDFDITVDAISPAEIPQQDEKASEPVEREDTIKPIDFEFDPITGERKNAEKNTPKKKEFPFELTNEKKKEPKQVHYEVGKKPDLNYEPPKSEKAVPKTKAKETYREEEIRRSEENLKQAREKITKTEDLPNHPQSAWVYNLGLGALICSFLFPTLAFVLAIISFVLRNNVKNYKGEEPYNTNNVLVRTGFILSVAAVIITTIRNVFFI